MSKKDVEELKIYQQYVTLIFYTEMITEKYPKCEKSALVSTIKNTTYSGMKKILLVYRAYDKKEKIRCLRELDIDLKMLKVFVRVSYKRRYINVQNYEAWSRKLYHLGNLLGGWILVCQRP